MTKEKEINLRKFIRDTNHFNGSSIKYIEERKIYDAPNVGTLNKDDLPKELKLKRTEKYNWHGFNNNPDFDKDFPIDKLEEDAELYKMELYKVYRLKYYTRWLKAYFKNWKYIKSEFFGLCQENWITLPLILLYPIKIIYKIIEPLIELIIRIFLEIFYHKKLKELDA